eukprot:snap_masked-scaffold_114-processed-gene-0.1-mRNA-1 protein AED:0.45 eAED:0.45 QI:0/0.33/0.5/0.5/0.66/0.5/4/417/77
MFRTSINHLGYWCVLTFLHFLTVDLLVDGVVAGATRSTETKCVLTFLHFLTVDLLVDGVVAGAARGTSRAVEHNQNV